MKCAKQVHQRIKAYHVTAVTIAMLVPPPPPFFFYVKYHSSSELGTVVAVLHDSYASRFQRCYVHRTTIDREIKILTELAVYIHFLTFLGDANFLRPEIHFLEVLLQ